MDLYNWDSILEEAKRIVEKNPDISIRKLAKKLNIPRTTLRDAMRNKWMVTHPSELLDINITAVGYGNQVPKLYGNFIVMADFEIPFHDNFMVNKAIQVGKRFGIDSLIIGGDFLCVDSVTTWASGMGESKISLRGELLEARKVLKTLSKQFKNIFMFAGNHEERLSRATNGQIDMSIITELIKPDDINLEYSNFYWAIVNDSWIVAHPSNYSKNPRTVALQLCRKYNMNVLSFHQHHASYSFDESGKYQIVDGGCITDQTLRHYKTVRINTMPNWVQAFSMLRITNIEDEQRTVCTLFPKYFTDWEIFT